MSRGKISNLEVGIITFMLLTGTAYTEFPAIMTVFARQSAWLCPIIALVPALIIIWTITWIERRFRGMTTVETRVRVLGPFFGKFTALFFSVVLLAAAALAVRTFATAIIVGTQNHLPLSLVVGVLVALQLYQVFWGIEVIARVAVIFLPYILLSVAAVVLGTANLFESFQLLPVLAAGPAAIGRGAWYAAGYLSEALFLSTMFVRVRDKRGIRRALVVGAVAAAVMIALITAWGTGVFGVNGIGRLVLPALELARLVSFGEAVQRLEAIFVVFWLMATVVRVGIFMWTAAEGTAAALNIRDPRVLLPAVGTLVFLLAMFPQSYWQQRQFGQLYAFSLQTVALVYLAVMVTVTLVRGVKGAKDDEATNRSG